MKLIQVARVVNDADEKSVQTSDAGDKGRKVILHTDDVEEGQLVLESEPFAKVLRPDLWSTRCQSCFEAAGSKLSRCGSCKKVYYCSKDCQREDWHRNHQMECRRMTQLTQLKLASEQLSDVLLLGRVLRKLQVDSDEKKFRMEISPNDMVWYEEDLASQEMILIAALTQKLGLVNDTWQLQELQKMLSRFQCNNFSITDELLMDIGAGCFPLGAMVNHSCGNNCVVTFTPKTQVMQFRALERIERDQELTQTYIDVALPKAKRQHILSSRYHFNCTCARCAGRTMESFSIDLFLNADISGVPQAFWSQQRQDQIKDAAKQREEGLKAKDPHDKSALLEKSLLLHKDLLHKMNVHLLELESELFSHYVGMQANGEAIAHGEAMEKYYTSVYTKNHPIKALHLFTLGDLRQECHQKKGQECVEAWTEALRILRITHGKCHSLVQQLEMRLSS